MLNRLRERAALAYLGGDAALTTPDPNITSTSTNANNSVSPPNDETHEPDKQLQATGTITVTDSDSSRETIPEERLPSSITQADGHDAALTHTVNNETNVHSQKFFSIFRLSQSATKLPIADATQTESNGQNDQTEQETHQSLPSVGEETPMDKSSNHADSGFEDTYSQEKPSLLSRMRISATKAFLETSATSLAGSIHSLSASRHAAMTTEDRTSIKATPSGEPHDTNNSDNIDTSNHSVWDFSDEIAQDPEISRLTEQIQFLKTEYYSIKESGKHAQRRRHDEYSKLKQYSNGKSRELWFASQRMRHFHGLADYKTELKRCSLPAHDTSAPTLTMEAKLLRAQHQGAILEHQLTIVHEFQQSMIDYLYTKALPDVKAEQELATLVGKSQLEKMIKARDTMVELFEACLGLQRKIIAKYRLREIEHSRGADGDKLKQEVEHLKVITGEIPAMERNPELRDSAKRRLEQRLQVKERQLERRKSREEDLIKATQKLIDDDKALVGKASEQLANISNHSMDLLLDITGNDDSDGDSAKVDCRQPSNQSATEEPNDEMESDSELDISHCSLNDTANGEGSNDLAPTYVSNDDNAKNHHAEPSRRNPTNEPDDDKESDSGPDTSQYSFNDTGNAEGSNDQVSTSESNNDNANDQSTQPDDQRPTKELHSVLTLTSDSDFHINQSNDTGDDNGPNELLQQSASNDNSWEEGHSHAQQSNADSKEGAQINATLEVSLGVEQPKEANVDATESKGRSRSTANRSSFTSGRNPPPGIARLRALRAERDLNSSEGSFGSTLNADGDQGKSEHSNSESGDDHLEPISPRSTARKSQLGLSSSQRYAARASTTGIRSRNELLDRARLARLSNQGGTSGSTQGSTIENAPSSGSGIVRPSLGIKAMSSRDFASRRSLAITNPATRSGTGLGGSEHQASLMMVSSSLSSSERSDRARTSVSIAAERQARMERIASRRHSSIEVSSIKQARGDEKPTISAERRAQIRAGLASRGEGTKVDHGGEGRNE